jgi:hypothetical protein
MRDIRDLADDPNEYAAELRRRWGGLLSYRYIGRKFASMELGPEDNTVTLRHDMRNSAGGLLFAVIGIASPEGGAMSDLEAVPNPVVHSCHIVDPGNDVRRIAVLSELLKRGRQMSYSRSRIVDADNPDRVLAFTAGQGASIGAPPAGLEKMSTDNIEVTDSPDLPPLWQVFGAAHRENHWELPELVVDVASPDGALHLGPQHVVLETAAIDAATKATGAPQLHGVTSHVMFVARGKVGPFVTTADVTAGVDGLVVVRVQLFDAGVDDRLITTGTYTFRLASGSLP